MDPNEIIDIDEKKDSWSEEMCIELIQAYRQHPVLYDPKDSYFYKRYAKISAWNSIGVSLQRPPRECKHKMSILLSSFRRQKSKFRRGHQHVSRWFGFKHLNFLLLINKEEHSMYKMLTNESDDGKSGMSAEDCNEVQPHEDPLPSPQDNNDDNGIDTLIVTEDDFIKTEIESDMDEDNDANSDKESSLPETNVITETQTQIIQNPGTSQLQIHSRKGILKEQEIDAFTKFVQSKLRKYSSKTITAVQGEICEILFKADKQLFKNS